MARILTQQDNSVLLPALGTLAWLASNWAGRILIRQCLHVFAVTVGTVKSLMTEMSGIRHTEFTQRICSSTE